MRKTSVGEIVVKLAMLSKIQGSMKCTHDDGSEIVASSGDAYYLLLDMMDGFWR